MNVLRNLNWLNVQDDGFILSIKVRPSAHQNAISVNKDSICVVSLQAAAEEGKANAMLVKYLAKYLGITQKQISLLKGHTGRNKIVRLSLNLSEQERLKKLFETLL